MTDYIKTLRQYIGHAPVIQCGASVIVWHENEILLELRADNNCWGYMGGAVEPGEDVEEAARREMLEESGLVAGKLTLFGVYSGSNLFYQYPNGDQVYNIDIVYHCNDFSGVMQYETTETKDLQWFHADKLPEKISPPVQRQLFDFSKWLIKKGSTSAKKITLDNGIIIRNAVPADAEGLYHLNFLFNGEGVNIKENIAELIADNKREIIYVAEANGELVGFCCGQLIVSMCYFDKNGEITELFVLPEYRRKGIARALVAGVESELARLGAIDFHLLTGDDNITAQGFYRSCGYIEDSEILFRKEIHFP